MKRLGKIAGFALLLISIGVLVVGCSTGKNGDESVLGGTRIIHENESINGNLSLFGGDVTLAKDAEVDGDLTVLGGQISIKEDAKVDGNLTVLGGQVILESGSEIDGDVTNLGGQIIRRENVKIGGEWHNFGGTEEGTTPSTPDDGDVAPEELPDDRTEEMISTTSSWSMSGMIFGFLGEILSILLRTLVFGLLGLVLTLFLPQHVRRVGYAAEKAPVASAAVGCFSIPALLVLSLVAVVTIIGIPIAILIPFFATAGAVLGWIGVGFFFGNRLLKMAEIRSPRPAAAAAIGAGSLVFVGSLAQIIPILGDLVMPFIGIWGLGATILTRGGRQSYPARARFDGPTPSAPIFDPLDELDFTAPPKKAGGGGGMDNLFADLAADLGIDDLFDDDDDKPNRPEKPIKPPK